MLSILQSIIGVGSSWLEAKNVKTKALAEAEAEVIRNASKSTQDWERIMASNNGSSWKDEWLTLLFSIPLILAFIPGGVEYAQAGFAALESMPTWYQYTLSVIVAASFGVRSAIGLIKTKKGVQ